MKTSRLLLAVLLLFVSLTYLWGVRRDLPNAAGSDEVDFLLIVAQMAATSDPNPHWFGHPGATFIYPYAVGLHTWNAAVTGGPWLGADPSLAETLAENSGAAILVGRLVSVAYGILAIWMICLVGDRAFGPPVGLIGSWLAVLSPLTLDHVDMARTDSAGLFFGFLAMWALLRLLHEPSPRAHVLAGLTLGLAIASRYFLAGLLPLLLAIDVSLLSRATSPEDRRSTVRSALIGAASVAVGLALSSPFLFLEINEVVANLTHETRGAHPGADGLDYLGNLSWYFTVALPRSVPWAVLALAGVGTIWSLVRRELGPLLLLGFVAIFLAGISFATLHWGRWLIQILPILALFAAAAIVWGVAAVVGRVGGSGRTREVALVTIVVAVSVVPALSYVRHARLQASPSTRDIAREWIIDNLTPGERIAADLYTAPLQNTAFENTDFVFSLAEIVSTPAELAARGYDIAMVSSTVYRRFLGTPERYPKEVGFYRTLFRKHARIAEFRPGPEGRGPVIRLYRLEGGPAS